VVGTAYPEARIPNTGAAPAEVKDIKAYCLDFNWVRKGPRRKDVAGPGTWAVVVLAGWRSNKTAGFGGASCRCRGPDRQAIRATRYEDGFRRDSLSMAFSSLTKSWTSSNCR
jgi:hypothetical protein